MKKPEKVVLVHIYMDKSGETLGDVYHTAIQVYDEKEWSYRFTKEGTGVFNNIPKKNDNPNYVYHTNLKLGTTHFSKKRVDKIISDLEKEWQGNDYNFWSRNSNDFCHDFCYNLDVDSLPEMLNRLSSGVGKPLEEPLETAKEVTETEITERINCNISKLTPLISNQKEEPICLPLVLADMMGTILRMHNDKSTLVLSPQPLINQVIYQRDHLIQDFVTSVGFESRDTCPFIPFKKDKWTRESYINRGYRRYHIDGIESVYNKKDIIFRLCDNFRDGGDKFPIFASVNLKTFVNINVSRRAANIHNLPYGYQKPGSKEENDFQKLKEDEVDHAMLVVGLDTSHTCKDQHWCWVKNTHGAEWGQNGFSRIVVRELKSIKVPIFNRGTKSTY